MEQPKKPVFADEFEAAAASAEPGAVGRVKDPWDEGPCVVVMLEATPKRDKYAGHVPARRTYRRAGALRGQQAGLADGCEVLLGGLARVGINAMIDEATGYQEIRDRKALQAILDTYLRKEFAVWARRFNPDFYEQMFRLKGWGGWDKLDPASGPRCIAACTKDLVYMRLTPGLLEELERRNPMPEDARPRRRSAMHHQYLSDYTGVPALESHVKAVICLMKAAQSWRQFRGMLDRSLPRLGHSVQLDIGDLNVLPDDED